MSHSDVASPSTEDRWPRLAFLCGLIAITVATRCWPHPWNFTPLGAVALFSGATLASRWWAIAVPMIAVLLSDLLIGMHTLIPAVYACLLFNVWLGTRLQGNRRPLLIGGSALLGAVVFFVVTNFACWAIYYPHTPGGLVSCYVLAVPYFGATVAGDLLFSIVLFGSLALVEWRFPVLRPASDSVAQ